MKAAFRLIFILSIFAEVKCAQDTYNVVTPVNNEGSRKLLWLDLDITGKISDAMWALVGGRPAEQTSITGPPTPDLTNAPTLPPTATPTTALTTSPTQNPTVSPTMGPTLPPTPQPTVSPTSHPTPNPTSQPTTVPTSDPTVLPTSAPTPAPAPNASMQVETQGDAGSPEVGSNTLGNVYDESSTTTTTTTPDKVSLLPGTLGGAANGEFSTQQQEEVPVIEDNANGSKESISPNDKGGAGRPNGKLRQRGLRK